MMASQMGDDAAGAGTDVAGARRECWCPLRSAIAFADGDEQGRGAGEVRG